MSTQLTVVKVSEFPKCDFCTDEARYDGATVYGPWAYMCPRHYRAAGRGLGTGVGQRLVIKEEAR